VHRYLNKKGLRPKRYKRSNPQRKPIRCSWKITRARKCKNPGQWMVKPVYRASRHAPLARAACRDHVVGVMNRFGSKKFTVTRVPDWISPKQWEEEVRATFEVEGADDR